MAKNTKRFKPYADEYDDDLRRKKIKKESRHNYKEHLKHMIEDHEWDELNDELYYEEHSKY